MGARSELRHGPARSLAALVLALFALGWLSDRAHVAFESHSYCTDHQRIEHGDAAFAHEHAADADHEAAHRAGPSIDALEGEGDGHEACCLLLARGGHPVAVLVAPTSPPAFVPAVAAPIALAGRASARGSVPLLALAPKQSPPAA